MKLKIYKESQKMKSRIKEIRKEKNLTQSEFGAIIGVKGNTVTNYETGLRNPSSAIILSICKNFNINEDWLINGTGPKYNAVSDPLYKFLSEIAETGERAKRALQKYPTMTNEEKEMLWKLIEIFLSK